MSRKQHGGERPLRLVRAVRTLKWISPTRLPRKPSALRAWLGAELPAHRAERPATDDEFTLHPDRSFDACLAWHRRLHRGGWVGIAWPREYGGRGATLVEQMIFQDEMVRAGAPPGVNTIGLMPVGPAIMEWGILAADEIWCQRNIIGERVLGLPR